MDNEQISLLLESNAKLAESIAKSLPSLIESLAKTNFKYTSKALLGLLSRSGYLNSAILSECSNGNVYSSAVLSRSIIEHNFRHLYIYVRALNENDDSVGERYCKNLRANEDLESFEKINNYNKVVYPEKDKLSTKGDNNNAIRESGKEFRIEQIFYYLVSNNNDSLKEIEQYKKEYLLGRLEQYTNFSSSVHGGPFGAATLENSHKSNIENDLLRFAQNSNELHKSLVEATYLFGYLMDGTLKDCYEEIKNI